MSQRAQERGGRRVVERPILQRRLLRRPDRPSGPGLPSEQRNPEPYPGPARTGRRGVPLVAPPAEPRLDRTADRIGSFTALLAVLMTVWSATVQLSEGSLTDRDALVVCAALPLTLATAVWARLGVRRNRTARPALLAHTLICLLQVVVVLPLWQPGPDRTVPPLIFTGELGAAAAWSCLSTPAAIADIVITALLLAPFRGAGSAGPASLGNAVMMALMGITFTLTWRAIVTVVSMSRRAAETSWRSSANLVAAREAEAASDHWDGLIHDGVLNALGAVARLPPSSPRSGPAPTSSRADAGRPDQNPADAGRADQIPADAGRAERLEASVRTLACDALTALHRSGERDSRDDIAEQLGAWAENLGLQVDMEISGTPPPAIGDQICRAGAEALTNVARHSGTTRARVTGRFSDSRAELRIDDDGRGFDPAQVSEGRRGLRTSVIGSMHSCGGRAEVRSAPGRGTSVWLRWQAPDISELDYSQIRFFGPVVGLFLLILAMMPALGLWQGGDVAVPAVQIGGTVLILGATAMSMAWRRLQRWMLIAIPAVVIACQIAMLANVRHAATPGWQEWFLTFGVGMYSALAWRTGSGIWLRISLLSWPVVTIVAALIAGVHPVLMLVSRVPSFMWPTVVAMASAWASNSLYSSLSSIRSSRDAAADAAQLRARAEASRHEAERRLATIEGAPMDMLVYLAAGEPITEQVRRECRLLEASTRDLLVAPFVVDTDMSVRFRAARERDAVISITGADAVQEDGSWDGAAEAFRQACVILADAAGPGASLTCRWHPRSTISRATVALTSGEPDGLRVPRPAVAAEPISRLEELRSSCRADVDIMDEWPDILATII